MQFGLALRLPLAWKGCAFDWDFQCVPIPVVACSTETVMPIIYHLV